MYANQRKVDRLLTNILGLLVTDIRQPVENRSFLFVYMYHNLWHVEEELRKYNDILCVAHLISLVRRVILYDSQVRN